MVAPAAAKDNGKAAVPHGVSLAAGAFAGVCSTCVTNPFDTLRVRLAASRDATGVGEKSLMAHLRQLFSTGVWSGFRVGLLMNLMSSVPSNAIYLPAYHVLSRTATERNLNPHAIPIVAAVGAVCTTNMTLSPMFCIRTLVQIDPSRTARQYANAIWRDEGVRGFYRGTGVNMAGRMVEEATFWYVYETLKKATNEGSFRGGNFGWASVAVLSLSSVSKLIGTSISYPYNVVMTHLREKNKLTGKHDHTRVVPTVMHIYRCDGVVGFYKGLAPQLIRSVLSKATQIWSFELAIATYLHWNPPVVQLSAQPTFAA